MGEKRKAPKGCYWRGDTLWGRFEVQGNEIRRSLRTDDAKIAEGRLKALREKEIAARRFGDARTTWEDAVLGWGAEIGSQTKRSTRVRYAQSLKLLEPYLRDLYVDEVNKTVVNDIVRRRRMDGVTNATIRRDLVALSSVLKFCEDQDWCDSNPALTKMRNMKERRDPLPLADPASIEAVIAVAPGNFGALIRAAWLTGARLDELRTLKRHSLDFRRGQVTLLGKGGKTRVIEMRESRSLFERMPVALRSPHVFWHSDGEPYLNISSNFRRLVAAAQKAAQKKATEESRRTGTKVESFFRPFRFHDLRHRFAVEFLKDGGSLYALSKHLGHTSVKTTEIYTNHLTKAEEEAARVGSAQNPDHEHGFPAQGEISSI